MKKLIPSRIGRVTLSLAGFFMGCALAGSLLNHKVAAQQAAPDEASMRDSLRQFANVYSLVEQNYAEPITPDKADKLVYDGAIPGMLQVLDPHSSFHDPKDFAQMREDQAGKYYGVGMSIQPQPDPTAKNGLKIVVLTPFEGAPSYKAGIHPGDVIVNVDGKSTAGMDSVAVASLLKGARNTHVSVTMMREGSPKPLVFDLIREEVSRPSVDPAFMIRPGIGYIHVISFMETTGKEVADALDRFGNIHGLVIDLRGNPGGMVLQAVAMTDQFLQRGQVVVTQKGRAFPDEVFRATHGSNGSHYPIVVLVGRNTASAAEIVSGALQDHDRALIVGETTFGKGLVQSVFELPEHTGLVLTTYHYFTPSGRLIQRNYNHVSLYDYYYVRNDAKAPGKNNTEVKLTDSGRTVYGGGGITPDEKIAPIKPNDFQDSLYRNYAFFNFAKHYLATRTISKTFQVDDGVMDTFKEFLKSQNINYTDADIASLHDWITSNIKSELFTSKFGQSEGLQVRADADFEIDKALEFLPEAQALEERALLVQHQQMASASR